MARMRDGAGADSMLDRLGRNPRPEPGPLQQAPAGCRYYTVSMRDALTHVVRGAWDLPNFQRNFVWNPAQVAMLADSLWRNYPIGPLLIWNPKPEPAEADRAWIADGQQRLTSIALLFGSEPAWWMRRPGEDWNALIAKNEMQFDAAADNFPRFVPGAGRGEARFVSVSEILCADPSASDGLAAIKAIAARVLSDRRCRCAEGELMGRLMRVASFRAASIQVIEVEHHPQDVMEMFDRLNSRGMRFRHLVLRTVRDTVAAMLGGGGKWIDVELREFRRPSDPAGLPRARR